MAPSEHLDWLDDNTEWFSSLPPSALELPVPACPGWNVEKVLTHLTYGLGLGYPYALAAAPDTSDSDAFAEVPWPTVLPIGVDALATFGEVMGSCRQTFRSTAPSQPCYTYAGPGIAGFWFRRAAIETTLHRMDVVEALGVDDELRTDRADDAVAEAVEFALPLAARWTGSRLPAVAIRRSGAMVDQRLGDGPIVGTISGPGSALLATLWGRPREGVAIDGDEAAVSAWIGVVERAFAGR